MYKSAQFEPAWEFKELSCFPCSAAGRRCPEVLQHLCSRLRNKTQLKQLERLSEKQKKFVDNFGTTDSTKLQEQLASLDKLKEQVIASSVREQDWKAYMTPTVENQVEKRH